MALPRGIRNNNPLNIRKGNNWQGERHPQTDPAFEEFESMTMGLRAGLKIIKNYQSVLLPRNRRAYSIRKIVHRWAPPIENQTDAYVQAVAKRTGLHPDEYVPFSDRKKIVAIVEAMCRVECGVDIDPALIESAYDLV